MSVSGVNVSDRGVSAEHAAVGSVSNSMVCQHGAGNPVEGTPAVPSTSTGGAQLRVRDIPRFNAAEFRQRVDFRDVSLDNITQATDGVRERLSGVIGAALEDSPAGSVLNVVLRGPSLARDVQAVLSSDNAYNADEFLEVISQVVQSNDTSLTDDDLEFVVTVARGVAAMDPADRPLCFPPQAAKPISVSDSRPQSFSSSFQTLFLFSSPCDHKTISSIDPCQRSAQRRPLRPIHQFSSGFNTAWAIHQDYPAENFQRVTPSGQGFLTAQPPELTATQETSAAVAALLVVQGLSAGEAGSAQGSGSVEPAPTAVEDCFNGTFEEVGESVNSFPNGREEVGGTADAQQRERASISEEHGPSPPPHRRLFHEGISVEALWSQQESLFPSLDTSLQHQHERVKDELLVVFVYIGGCGGCVKHSGPFSTALLRTMASINAAAQRRSLSLKRRRTDPPASAARDFIPAQRRPLRPIHQFSSGFNTAQPPELTATQETSAAVAALLVVQGLSAGEAGSAQGSGSVEPAPTAVEDCFNGTFEEVGESVNSFPNGREEVGGTADAQQRERASISEEHGPSPPPHRRLFHEGISVEALWSQQESLFPSLDTSLQHQHERVKDELLVVFVYIGGCGGCVKHSGPFSTALLRTMASINGSGIAAAPATSNAGVIVEIGVNNNNNSDNNNNIASPCLCCQFWDCECLSCECVRDNGASAEYAAISSGAVSVSGVNVSDRGVSAEYAAVGSGAVSVSGVNVSDRGVSAEHAAVGSVSNSMVCQHDAGNPVEGTPAVPSTSTGGAQLRVRDIPRFNAAEFRQRVDFRDVSLDNITQAIDGVRERLSCVIGAALEDSPAGSVLNVVLRGPSLARDVQAVLNSDNAYNVDEFLEVVSQVVQSNDTSLTDDDLEFVVTVARGSSGGGSRLRLGSVPYDEILSKKGRHLYNPENDGSQNSLCFSLSRPFC
ncbi:hypothetical protein ABVT39_006986 [Epinephelus coioides]